MSILLCRRLWSAPFGAVCALASVLVWALNLGAPATVAAADVELAVDVDSPGPPISPQLYGIFFEDINFGGDGGLSAELVKNGGFEFPQALMGWREVRTEASSGSVRVLRESPRRATNVNYLRIDATEIGSGYGIVNEGYRGIGVRQGEKYDFSAWVRSSAGSAEKLLVRLVGPGNALLAEEAVEVRGSDWREVTATLTPTATEAHATLELLSETPGVIDLDIASLYPQKTWKNRPRGLRADLVQLLADLKPAFFRFPGGCIVEGSQLKGRYQWKTTIGDPADRRLLVNRWNMEFRHRLAPDYYQSFALGFFEYFQLCEDIGAAPLPILNCGMACQFNTGELAPLEELEPYVQDALDLIEFANGDPKTSEWGARRAQLGHPEPFHLKLLGIGNEQWGPEYLERYKVFAAAIKKAHPEVKLISSAGPSPADERFQYLWPQLRELKADIVDEHSYATPDWFRQSATRYDGYPRKGPKVFMGEYAAQSVAIASPDNRNNLACALGEAAFMTGLERNSDVVAMSSYAPLFGHEEAWQWRPNLIWFDNLTSYPTPNDHVQKLFSLNRGDVVLPVKLTDEREALAPAGAIGFATYQSAAEFKDVSVTREERALFPRESDESESSSAAPAVRRIDLGGRWVDDRGVVKQTDRNATGRSVFGDYGWSDYTVRLKARKTGGREGFMVQFRVGAGGSYLQWNLGGWGNSQHGLQRYEAGAESVLEQKPGRIEEGRWYDVRIELEGDRVRCYLDDKLIHSLTAPASKIPNIFATASREKDDGAVILKVVNTSASAAKAAIRLDGLDDEDLQATATVLAGEPTDENTIAEPAKLAPVEVAVEDADGEFTHEFPSHSLTILRLE
ncbi:MAG TPA: alpha-L-arabinofuranosidase C-terminal domain-containing protein [Lacipirellulaceae bacterium]|nr:alpha-L-arabinofuranosidase C-terminal domain-containing protein [Lacipirellulaceae bacterium]